MTTSLDLLDAAQVALLGAGAGATPPVYATAAGSRVLKPGDWPTWDSQYPVLKLRVSNEVKQSLGHSGPAQFAVTTTVSVLGQVDGPASVDDGGAAAVETALWQLAHQVEAAVIGDPALGQLIQQWTGVRSQLVFNAEGEKHLAGIGMDIDLLFYQGPDDFAPVPAVPLTSANIDLPGFPVPPGEPDENTSVGIDIPLPQ